MGKEVLYETGELDVLPYYAKASKVLAGFLKNKPIASKVHVPGMFFLNRGSNKKPLFVNDFSVVNAKMLDLRKNHLKDVKDKLNEKQILIWEYFPPRKMSHFFYACNGENPGKPIERIFIDIDRRKQSADKARTVASELVDLIKNDKEFNKLLKPQNSSNFGSKKSNKKDFLGINKIIVLWTGSSFHVYIMLKNLINLSFYNSYLSYGSGKNKQESFIMKWAEEISKKTKIPVSAGHEKSEKFIILDSSNTPSGKLARVPFSLHVKDWKAYDGVCVPVAIDELGDKNSIKKLNKLTPDEVLKDLEKYKKLL